MTPCCYVFNLFLLCTVTGVNTFFAMWFTAGFYNASSIGETGTLASANSLSASETFTFPNSANTFYYYGIQRCCGGKYAICVDCNPDNFNFEFIDVVTVNTSDDGKNPPVILCSKNFDKPGIHDVILANQNDTRYGKPHIALDHSELQVEDPDTVQPGSATSTPNASP
ncbi:hypothetical protein DFS33DRAFT_494961 [Desarmillaria ectypa]|nr:hypothetical protein DFS33DRAFT_494961 [Desarmillaria ectypa]